MGAQLNQLILSNIRNLRAVDLKFGAQFNVFTGVNGSGKTSLLEAIYLLGVGRSFRAKSMRQVISFDAEQCLIRAKVRQQENPGSADHELWLAVERSLAGLPQYKIGENVEKSAAEFTRALPIQLIDVNSHLLLEGGPNYRRQFIDWGVFHVEHSFLQNWRLMQRALEQRNAALRFKQMPAEMWNEAFIKHAEAVETARSAYVKRFSANFLELVAEMLALSSIEVRYNRGWPENQDLASALQDSVSSDLSCGYTRRGPQRADLEFLIDGKPVREVFSRGQIKIFVCLMLLTRANFCKMCVVFF